MYEDNDIILLAVGKRTIFLDIVKMVSFFEVDTEGMSSSDITNNLVCT